MVGRVRSRFFVLLGLLLCILLVQVLPEVDLPATAFCQNSEPLSIHAAIVASPLLVIFAFAVHSMPPYGRGSLHLLSLTVFSAAANAAHPIPGLRC
jgi:hypothetical protein